MTTTLRVTEPHDIVAFVHYQLGFVPRESLVLVSLRGPRRRVGLVVRVDLPVAEHRRELAEQLVTYLGRDGAGGSLVLVYTDQPWLRYDSPPHRQLLDVVAGVLQDARMPVREALHVTPETFRSYWCEDTRCCPLPGSPVDSASASQVAPEMVLRGRSVAASREELLAGHLPMTSPSAAVVARVVAEAARWSAAGSGHRWRRTSLNRWRAAVHAARGAWPANGGSDPEIFPDPADAGRLLAALKDVRVRDAALLCLVPGSGRVPDEVIAGRTPAMVGDLLDSAPDAELVAAARSVLAQLVAVGRTGDWVVSPLVLLGWIAWSTGDGLQAGAMVEQALAVDPHHVLAQLLGQMVTNGVPAAWVAADRDADLAGAPRRLPA